MPEPEPELDIVVWGASGYTGRLVAAYLLERYSAEGDLRWALGGRSQSKLEAVRDELAREGGAAAEALPLVLGDADDEGFLASLADRTRVVCTTVGPYALYGSKLVAACARQGTHYCDLTGEVQWMRRMIDAHEAEAAASGARIVHCCGFDCIPSDLGAFFLQREMRARHGVACARIKYRVVSFRGGFSGGTMASMLNVMEEAGRDPEVRRLLADPYGLDPAGGPSGPDSPDRMTPSYDDDFGSWTAPFVMSAIDTKVVRRTNALLAHAYGVDFRYDEATLTGAGPVGFAKAAATSAGLAAAMTAGAIGPLRRALAHALPSPGEGPTREQRETGHFEIALFGEHPQDRGKSLRGRIRGDRDPGYGSTAKMLGESAVCLARDALDVGGGFWTPAAGLGEALLRRLPANAGVRFAIEDTIEED